MKAFFMALILVLSISCSAQSSRSFDIEDYSELEVGGPYLVTLRSGSTPSIRLIGESEIIDNTTVKIEGRTLVVKLENGWKRWGGNQDRVEVEIVFTELEAMYISGACKLIAEDRIGSDYFELDVSGASTVEMSLEGEELRAEVSGASTINIEGEVIKQRIDLSGASSYKARDLISERCVVDGSGASNATVHATEEIRAESSGASSVYYYGDPKYVDANSSGAGSVRRRG